jgi:hypothetical protein
VEKREKIIQVFKKHQELFLPPDIPIEVLEKRLDEKKFRMIETPSGISFIKFLPSDTLKGTEAEYFYNGGGWKGGYFLLSEILKEVERNEGWVFGSCFLHNKGMVSIYKKMAKTLENYYCWTLYFPEFEYSKQTPKEDLITSLKFLGSELRIVFNGIYLSAYFETVPNYLLIRDVCRDFSCPYFVVYHRYPNLKRKTYKVIEMLVDKEKLIDYLKKVEKHLRR